MQRCNTRDELATAGGPAVLDLTQIAWHLLASCLNTAIQMFPDRSCGCPPMAPRCNNFAISEYATFINLLQRYVPMCDSQVEASRAKAWFWHLLLLLGMDHAAWCAGYGVTICGSLLNCTFGTVAVHNRVPVAFAVISVGAGTCTAGPRGRLAG